MAGGALLTIDPTNPVVAAIGRGMHAEITGDRQAAHAAYSEAWERAADDFERCIAAHYVPRVVDDPADKLRWNELALRHATAVGDDRVLGFFASLHACVGQVRLGVGDATGARDAFRLADASLADVPDGPYREGLVAMIGDGMKASEGEVQP
jgi:hypothetical protein